MKNPISYYFLSFAGVALLSIGIIFIKTIEDPHGILRVLPYICVGLGCGIFGHGMGEIINRHLMKNNPAAAKQMEIEKNDERNLAIANRAKAKAYDMIVFLFGALLLAFALMGIDKITVFILAFAYMFILGYNVYYRVKYYKEM
ncbi:hypothetical protein [Paenibacillus sp. P36]|uniref:hypothetical protein n=1 Tax=Paenibacillus sp. P36 TaxID=3342538 RepID=UPI0038B2E49F